MVYRHLLIKYLAQFITVLRHQRNVITTANKVTEKFFLPNFFGAFMLCTIEKQASNTSRKRKYKLSSTK